MIIWLNGTFGAGKTTTGRQLAGRLANARLFDPEEVGYLLMRTLEDHEFRDFQDLAPWRELVPVFTENIALFTGQHLIAVQTVLREEYWQELTAGFERTRLDIFHVLLHVDSDVLAERIKADEVLAVACQWRLDHIGDYEKARPWMESAADLVIDTTHVPAAEVAERIAVEAERRMAAASSLCGGIRLRAVGERACDQETVAAQGGVEGTLPPRPVLERARRRIHGLMGTVDGCYLPHGTSMWNSTPAPRNGLSFSARNCGSTCRAGLVSPPGTRRPADRRCPAASRTRAASRRGRRWPLSGTGPRSPGSESARQESYGA